MTTIPEHSPIFYRSHIDAINAGELSRSKWHKAKRKVKEDAEPNYVVNNSCNVDVGHGDKVANRKMYTIIRDISPDVAEVALDYYRVYSHDQTEPIVPRRKRSSSKKSIDVDQSHDVVQSQKEVNKESVKRKENNNKNVKETTTHSPLYTPYDAESIENIDGSSLEPRT